MKSLSLKRPEVECSAESDTTRALREILGISMNEDLFEHGEAVAVIGALAERALHRFEEITLSSAVHSSEVVALSPIPERIRQHQNVGRRQRPSLGLV